MKKFVSLMFAALFLPGISAANNDKQFTLLDKRNDATVPQRANVAEGLITRANDVKRHSDSQSGEVTDVIEEAPEGKVGKFDRAGLCFTTLMDGSTSLLEYDNGPAEIVECENGDVYVQMPFFGFPINTYIVGHREDNKVVFDLPQTVYKLDYGNGSYECYNATLGQFNGQAFVAPNSDTAKECGLPEIPEADNKIVLTVDENGVYSYSSGLSLQDSTLDVEFGDTALSLCDAYSGWWIGYSEVYSTWKPFEGVLVTPPEGLSTETMGFTYNGIGHLVEVGFNESDIYIKGLVPDFPDSWIKGTIDGSMIRFDSGQYLGENVRYGAYTYFASAKYDASGDMEYLDYSEYYYDALSRTITAPENVAALYNGASDYIHYIEMYKDFMIRPQVENPDKTLNAPHEITFIDGYYPSFIFYYSTLNKDGYILDVDNIYFKMYVDGEEFTFTPDEYITIENPMTFVPVTFNDYYDFMVDQIGSMRVGIYFEGFNNVGFKLFYIEGDVAGEDFKVIGESEMALYELSGIKEINATDDKAIIDTKYYDLMGNECQSSFKGLCVKTLKYTDGSVKSFKIIKK